MWGFGGNFYWGRKGRGRGEREGIVVIFAWMSSQERHLNNYVRLYSSLNWNSLVCHSQFLNMFFPEKAEALVYDILSEIVKEIKISPCPVVFASFSGGPKACMYKVLQMIEGICEAQLTKDDLRLVKDCFSGHIYDSSPVDFTSDLGTRFVVHPTVLKMSRPPRLVSWIANGIASGLDALFLARFEAQRAEYWQTLYSFMSLRVPHLILCSEKDDLAPYETIYNFAQRLQELRADVKLVKWNDSPHVGHYRHYPIEYEAAVTELLGKASALYSKRIQPPEGVRLGFEGTRDEIPGPFSDLRKAAASSSSVSFEGSPLIPGDHLFLLSSMEHFEGRDVGSVNAEQKESLIHLPSSLKMNPHGVLGQILFDVCVPKDIEDWDIRSASSLKRHRLASSGRHAPFNPMKCIRRSRL